MSRICTALLLVLLPATSLTAHAGDDKDKPFKIEGKLADTDPKDRVKKTPINEHAYSMKAGATYVIGMVSTEVDSYLYLLDPKGVRVAEDDDGAGYPNSRILYKAEADGAHKIICTCFATPQKPFSLYGKYTLTVRPATEADLKKIAAKGKAVLPPVGGYTPEQLIDVLTKLGYEPTVYGVNKDRCWIYLNRGNYRTTVSFSISGDRTNLWLDCPLATIAFPAQAPAKAMRRLLEENDKLAPAHFVYEASDKRLHLYQPLGNRELTPAKLRKEIEKFDDVLRKAEPIWRIDNFLRLDTVPDKIARPEIDKLEGTWKLVEGREKGKDVPAQQLAKANLIITIEGNKLNALTTKQEWTYFIDPRNQPKAIDFIGSSTRIEAGIYKLEGDRLTIHLSPVGAERPANFTVPERDMRSVLVLERQKQ